MRDLKLLTSAVIFSGLLLVGPARAGTLAAHRALYELEPQRVDRSSTVMPMDGRIAYEVTGSTCEGWTVNYRIANRYQQAEKGEQIIDTQLSTFETGDGLELNLSQKQFVNNQPADEERLNVKRPKAGSPGKGVMTAPKNLEFEVASEALFPSAHEDWLIAQAMKGVTHDVSTVYDGSDGEKLFKAVAFIGKKREPGTFSLDAANPEAKPLQSIPSWPVTISYYPFADDKSENPSYQASFNIYENGVSTDLVLDYGAYALKGKLVKLEMLKSEACDPAKIKPQGD